MNINVEDIEILAESSSLYVERLKDTFTREELYSHLKSILLKNYPEEAFPIISKSDDTIYIIFTGKIQTKLEGFAYHKESFEKMKDKFSEDFLDNFHKELYSLYEKFLENIGRDIYILDSAIRKFLIYIINDNRKLQNFGKSMFYVFNLIHNDISKNMSNFKELEFARYLLRGRLISNNITDLNFRAFLTDDEDNNFIVNLFSEYSSLIFPEDNAFQYKLTDQKDSSLDLNLQKSKNRIKELFNQLSGEIDKFSVIELIERLDKLDDVLKINIGALRGIKQYAEQKGQRKLKSFELSFLLNYIGHNIDKLLSNELLNEISKSLEKKKAIIPQKYLSKKIFRTEYDFEKIGNDMKNFYVSVFEPTILSKIVESMIEIWPITKYKPTTFEEARWVGLRGRTGNVFIIPDKKLEEKVIQNKNILLDFINNVSVLIYDIRGSSFMGFKLSNAKKEEEIRNKFQKRILNVVLKYGGFPIKDTGDGGIILFSSNSHELFTLFKQFRMGKQVIASDNLTLIEGDRVSHNAILCARDMVLESKNFVKENLKNYEDWFKQVEGFKLQYRGITYDELPPSIKRIFQVGIGIASGSPDKDVSFSINSFGEPDLTGNLVREANLFSKVREKDESTIIVDLRTFLSFLVSLEEFLPEDVMDGKFSQLLSDDIYFKEMMNWYNGIRGRYLIKKHNILINKVFAKGYLDEDEYVKDVKILEESIVGGSYKKIYDSKIEKERSVYKIIIKE